MDSRMKLIVFVTVLGVVADGRAENRADAFGDPLPDGALARLGTHRLRHSGPIYCEAFSPDGKLFAYGGVDRDTSFRGLGFDAAQQTATIVLWDLEKGQLRPFAGRADRPISQLKFSRDGARIAAMDFEPRGAATNRNRVRVWEVATGRELPLQLPPLQPNSRMGFTPDGRAV